MASNILVQAEANVRETVLEHATKTKHAVHDPSSFISELLVQQQQYACLEWLVHFDVLEGIPLPPAAISYQDIASQAKVPITTLRSALRMVMTMGLLGETRDGLVRHNRLSAAFVQDSPLRTWFLHVVNFNVPLMRGLIRASDKYGETKKLNETAYNVAFDTDLTFFEHLKSRPDLESEFDAYMKSQAAVNKGASVDFLVQGFDWASLGQEQTVVDVGGGSGSASITLAKAYPNLRFVVQDQALPIKNAADRLAEAGPDISQRIQLTEHDFFQPQPVKHAAVYLLRMIIHDWPDDEAVKILRRQVDAMGPGSRIVIMDMVLPKPGSGSTTLEAALRQKDLSMLMTFNSKERESSDWYDLIQKVSPDLGIHAVQRPDGSQHSVIEVGFRETNGIR